MNRIISLKVIGVTQLILLHKTNILARRVRMGCEIGSKMKTTRDKVRWPPNRSRAGVRTIKLKGRTVIVEDKPKRLKANKAFGN